MQEQSKGRHKYDYYLAGPMRGLPDHNYPTFNIEARMLREWDYTVFNPAESFNGETDRDFSEYMTVDYLGLIDSERVFFLPGWQKSEGARLEYLVAESLGKEIEFHPLADPTPPVELEASKLVRNGEREAAYGHPNQDLTRTAGMWSAILGLPVTPQNVALCMAALKISRLVSSPGHRDSLTDLVGYAVVYDRIKEVENAQG